MLQALPAELFSDLLPSSEHTAPKAKDGFPMIQDQECLKRCTAGGRGANGSYTTGRGDQAEACCAARSTTVVVLWLMECCGRIDLLVERIYVKPLTCDKNWTGTTTTRTRHNSKKTLQKIANAFASHTSAAPVAQTARVRARGFASGAVECAGALFWHVPVLSGNFVPSRG